jgi:hypothetical protein
MPARLGRDGMMNGSDVALDHYYLFGDMYETLDACEQLDVMLSRLRRQSLISDEDLRHTQQNLAAIRQRVEHHLNHANLMPKGPRLP